MYIPTQYLTHGWYPVLGRNRFVLRKSDAISFLKDYKVCYLRCFDRYPVELTD